MSYLYSLLILGYVITMTIDIIIFTHNYIFYVTYNSSFWCFISYFRFFVKVSFYNLDSITTIISYIFVVIFLPFLSHNYNVLSPNFDFSSYNYDLLSNNVIIIYQRCYLKYAIDWWKWIKYAHLPENPGLHGSLVNECSKSCGVCAKLSMADAEGVVVCSGPW